VLLLGNGDGTFQPARSYSVGRDPYSVAVADLTGNGIADLVVANESSASVSVLLGNGDGTFRSIGSFGAGTNPYSVTVGDFYGDGIPALAVAGLGGTRVLRGNGDGRFQDPHFSYSTDYSTSVVSGDFHGDGLPDLAVANGYFDHVFLLNNDGHGKRGRATPRGERSGGAQPKRETERVAAGLLALEAMQAALHSAAVRAPGATVQLVEDSRLLLGCNAEKLWTPVAQFPAGSSEPAGLALAAGRTNRAMPWLADCLFAEPDDWWLW